MIRAWPLLIGLGCAAPESRDPFQSGGGSLLGADTGSSPVETGESDTGQSQGGDDVQAACESGEPGTIETIQGQTLSSEVVWTLEFDEDAEANGFWDCTYARTYEGQSRGDVPWLCQDCDWIFEGTASMSDGLDCYSQIVSEPTESRIEMWGIAGDALHRSGSSQAPMGELATFEGSKVEEGWSAAIGWASDYELTDGGNMNLSAAGTMTWGEDDAHVYPDPWGPRSNAYTCEWECNDPGDLAADYELVLGNTIPNARLEDACGESVDLWDFYGSYLVIDSSQSDCGPCRSMAETEHEFIEQMQAAGIPVRVVTLLGNGLGDPTGTPDQETFDAWVSDFDLTEPVLKDKGYAYALFPSFFSDTYGDAFGYPAWLVVTPEMKLLYGNVGFSSWDNVAEVIEEDWASR